MKFSNQAILTGIKESQGEFEGKKFSSTTFHLIVDVAQSGSGRSIGQVTRPFKMGDASEFEKWKNWAEKWPTGGLVCDCQFEVVAGSDNKSELKLLGIKPAASAAPAKAA
ncbi:MAG: hypothetical protein E6Q78_03070 [Rhodoferax sp.]|nr:MAG: hypothetical protein E6Q78_03070 [Rhodoferax sp.]